MHTMCSFHLLFTLRVFSSVCLLPGLQWLPVLVSTCTASTSGAPCLSGTHENVHVCVCVCVCVCVYTMIHAVERYILPFTLAHLFTTRLGIQINKNHRLALQLFFHQHNMCVNIRLPLSHTCALDPNSTYKIFNDFSLILYLW